MFVLCMRFVQNMHLFALERKNLISEISMTKSCFQNKIKKYLFCVSVLFKICICLAPGFSKILGATGANWGPTSQNIDDTSNPYEEK